MEIIELKKTVTKIKISMLGLNGRMEITEDRSSELKEISIECTQSEQQKENRLKKINRVSGKELIFILLEFQKEWREGERDREEKKEGDGGEGGGGGGGRG